MSARKPLSPDAIVGWVSGSVGRSVSWSDGKSKLSHVRSHQSICRFEEFGPVAPSAVGLAPNTWGHTSGFTHLGLHSSGAGPRWGTPRASPPPPGAPGGDIPVKPEVFLTPSRARASVHITLEDRTGTGRVDHRKSLPTKMTYL